MPVWDPNVSASSLAKSPATPVETALCCVDRDLFSVDSRLLMGRALRDFLSQRQITPTELLHCIQHVRKLEDDHGSLARALHTVGVAQAREYQLDQNARIRELNQFVVAAREKARDFADDRRRLPKLDGDTLDASARRIRKAVGDDAFPYIFTAQLCYGMHGLASLTAKLRRVLHLAGDTQEAVLLHAFDMLTADILAFPDMLIEVFGRPRHRAQMIAYLADFLARRPPHAAQQRTVEMIDLSRHISDGQFPETRAVLVHWMVRELDHEGPLNQHDPEQEDTLIDGLITRLLGADGQPLGGQLVEAAVNRRRLRARQTKLRAMGLDEVALTLADSWQHQPLAVLAKASHVNR